MTSESVDTNDRQGHETEAAHGMAPESPKRAAVGLATHLPLALILIGYITLALAFNWATPVGESPDEPTHYQYALHLLEKHSLPVIAEPGEVGLVQAKHPPLYYLAAAAIGAWADFDTLGFMPNPHFSFNFERAVVPNAFVHFDHERFPYNSAEGFLAARVMRLLSLACGLVVVLATHQLARLVWPEWPYRSWAAAGVVAFLPGFLFFSGVFNNDALANALMALILVWSTRVVLGRDRDRDFVLLGSLLGLGLITKMTTLSGLGVAGLALLAHAYRLRAWRSVLRPAVLVGTPAALISGWWFVRNILLYGVADPLGLDRWAQSVQDIQRDRPLTSELGAYFWVQLTTFFARFGWEAVRLPDTLYKILIVLVLMSALGLALVAVRRRSLSVDNRWGLAFVATSVVIMYLSVLRLGFSFNLIVAHGRYLYVALAGFGLLFTTGILAFLPERLRPAGALATVVGFATLSVTSLAWLLIPAYEVPSPLSAAEAARGSTAVDIDYDGRFRLYGYDLSQTRPTAGDVVTVTLDWGSLPASWEQFPPPSEGHIVFVHLVDASGEVVGRVDAMPFGGVLPTIGWPPGRVYREAHQLAISPDAVWGPATLLIGLYDSEAPFERLDAAEDGTDLGDAFVVPGLVILPDDPAALQIPVAAGGRSDLVGAPAIRDGAWARLSGYEAELVNGGWAVTLYWESLAPTTDDRTVFVHVKIDGRAEPATGDSPPSNGQFATSLWAPGDLIVDQHFVSFPAEGQSEEGTPAAAPATARLLVGMYDPESGSREPIFTAEGDRWPDDAVDLGQVDVPDAYDK